MIDRSTIFRQVRHDLFGSKDAQDASTLTYTWVADQFGHVTLGFIATLFFVGGPSYRVGCNRGCHRHPHKGGLRLLLRI
jgi:hypothetical protein